MAQRESTQDGSIQFKELGGMDQRPAPSNLGYPLFGFLHGLYPPRDGRMQRLEGTEWLAQLADFNGVRNIVQLDDGTGDVLVQTDSGSEVRYTLNELFGRPESTVNLTPVSLETEEEMSIALIVHTENYNVNGGSLNSGAGSEALNTWYRQKLTANTVNEDSIVSSFVADGGGADENTWQLAAGIYRVDGEMVFCYSYTVIDSAIGTVTITVATPAVFTAAAAHGLTAGDAVTLATTGALPTGLTAGTQYYVIAAGLTATQFELSATVGGAAINTTGTQSGTHTLSGVAKQESCAGVIYDETNTTQLAVFSPGYSSELLTTAASNPTSAVNLNTLITVSGRFTLAGTAKISVQAAVNSASGTPFASATTCRGRAHNISTTIGGSAVTNTYTSIRILKEP